MNCEFYVSFSVSKLVWGKGYKHSINLEEIVGRKGVPNRYFNKFKQEVAALRIPLRMPPKKEEVVKKVKLGRPGNTLKMGIVGLPNVGKSTTFNLLSNLNIPAENYPFCTIDPNLAKVFVDDERFNKLCDM